VMRVRVLACIRTQAMRLRNRMQTAPALHGLNAAHSTIITC